MASKLTVRALVPTAHERFKIELVNRRDIKGAPYNPRKITVEARRRLKEKLAEVGLVEPLIWNRTTGNLLSGHQRISILDELEGSNNYALEVSVVALDARKEKALNVFLNNRSSQGEFDMAALEALVHDLGNDVAGTGFAKEDLSFLVNDLNADTRALVPTAHEESLERVADEIGNQLVVYFKDSAAVQEFLRSIGKPAGERYVKGEEAAKALEVEL